MQKYIDIHLFATGSHGCKNILCDYDSWRPRHILQLNRKTLNSTDFSMILAKKKLTQFFSSNKLNCKDYMSSRPTQRKKLFHASLVKPGFGENHTQPATTVLISVLSNKKDFWDVTLLYEGNQLLVVSATTFLISVLSNKKYLWDKV